ncbi:hypothetical protein PF007_g8950 [Phytophthora fragariae]|uniref:DEAD/DEAH box helicase domain-containing protein n=2 Tax=Phytophthora fragariae TaxID=53985 RepID=A0A6A3SUI9_9STRA|nr:hypothetical protein PF007_g8950 [Phytophthora fragariae]
MRVRRARCGCIYCDRRVCHLIADVQFVTVFNGNRWPCRRNLGRQLVLWTLAGCTPGRRLLRRRPAAFIHHAKAQHAHPNWFRAFLEDQFNAFGSSIVVRCAVIAGGVDMLKQSLALQLRPHIIVATPSRFRDHLLRVNPPNISPADQAADALVSAMMTPTLDRLEQTALSDDAFLSNATPSVRTADPCRNLPGCHLTK